MASAVGICNLALGFLGDEATVSSIDPPEGSMQAEHCAAFYPVARNIVLTSHEWSFATRRMPLVELADEEPPAEWAYVYQFPGDCLKPLQVLMEGQTPIDAREKFQVESLADGNRVIYTNTPDAQLRFIARVDDTTKFGALVELAIARLLASFLAGPIIKGEAGANVSAAQLLFYAGNTRRGIKGVLALAQEADGFQRQTSDYNDFTPARFKFSA
jgi:hypothetical protein